MWNQLTRRPYATCTPDAVSLVILTDKACNLSDTSATTEQMENLLSARRSIQSNKQFQSIEENNCTKTLPKNNVMNKFRILQ